jgi:predicted enzyme related to lactoylglutathione lyase
VWYDLMTTDVEGAKAFYGDVVGWTTAPWGDGPMPYQMWMAGASPIGGVMALSDAMRAGRVPPHWMAYICVPDADATAQQAVSLGGRILVPAFDIKDVGRIVILSDPQGVAFAVYTPSGSPPGHEGPPRLQEFSWHELSTTDEPAAFGFYSALFGWQSLNEHDMGPMGVYREYGRADRSPIGGMMNKPPEQPVPGWCYYVHVADVHAGAERAKARGGRVLHGPVEVPGGDWIVTLQDPQGAVFALHHHTQA